MADTFFILNGPDAGELHPYSNAAYIQKRAPSGRMINYEPAPPEPDHDGHTIGPHAER
jgi:hypothetical protein